MTTPPIHSSREQTIHKAKALKIDNLGLDGVLHGETQTSSNDLKWQIYRELTKMAPLRQGVAIWGKPKLIIQVGIASWYPMILSLKFHKDPS